MNGKIRCTVVFVLFIGLSITPLTGSKTVEKEIVKTAFPITDGYILTIGIGGWGTVDYTPDLPL